MWPLIYEWWNTNILSVNKITYLTTALMTKINRNDIVDLITL